MLIRNLRVFTCILVFSVTVCIFPSWAFAQGNKIDPNLLPAMQAEETVPAIIRLQGRPNRDVAQAVKARFYPDIEAIASEIRNKVRPFLEQRQPLPPDVEQEVRMLQEDLDDTIRQMRREIRTQIWDRVSGNQQMVRQAVEAVGGMVHAQVAVLNLIGAQLPSDAVNQIASLPQVRLIELDTEQKPELQYSVPTINASSFWNAGYNGWNFDIGVVDKGVDADHSALSSHSVIKRNPNDESRHGTNIAGVVASTDGTDKGVAYGLDKIIDASFDESWSDAVDAMEWAVATADDDAEVLNYSYGLEIMSQGTSDYSSKGQDVDEGAFISWGR